MALAAAFGLRLLVLLPALMALPSPGLAQGGMVVCEKSGDHRLPVSDSTSWGDFSPGLVQAAEDHALIPPPLALPPRPAALRLVRIPPRAAQPASAAIPAYRARAPPAV